MKRLIFFLSVSLFSSVWANDCEVTRAAYDIGSGTTKLKVAIVDTCKQEIKKILHESNRSVCYKQALKESENNTLDKDIIQYGIKNILELKDEALAYNPKSFIAVATSAFRTASNGIEAVK